MTFVERFYQSEGAGFLLDTLAATTMTLPFMPAS